MKKTEIAVGIVGEEIGIMLTSGACGYGRGHERSVIMLSRDAAAQLRDKIDEALREEIKEPG